MNISHIILICLIIGVIVSPPTGDIVCEHDGKVVGDMPYCECEENWSGIACSICTNDDACTIKDTTTCDTSMIVGTGKEFECFVSDPDFVELIGDRVRVSCSSTSECSFSAWGRQKDGYGKEVYYQTFYCAAHNLSSSYNWDTRSLLSTSLSTECTCIEGSDRCNDEYVSLMIDNIGGKSEIECNLIEKTCVLDPSDFPGKISLTCYGGGCLPELLPFPDNQNATRVIVILSWKAMTLDSLAFLLVLFFLFTIISLIILEAFCCIRLHNEDRLGILDREVFTLKLRLTGGGYIGNAPGGACLTQLWAWIVSVCCKDTTFADDQSKQCVLHELLLTVDHGTTAVLGDTGSGKTTLINMLSNSSMRGKVGKGSTLLINDVPAQVCCSQLSPKLSMKNTLFCCCYLFCNQVSYPRLLATAVNPGHPVDHYLTVEEYIHTSASFRNYHKRRVVSDDVQSIIHDLDLYSVRNRVLGTTEQSFVSQGERKRVIIASQLASRPNILIADEAMEDMDEKHARHTFLTIKKWMPQHKTTILTMHNPSDEVFRELNHIIVMDHGRLVLHTSSEEVISYVDSWNQSKIVPGKIRKFIINSDSVNERDDEEEEEEELVKDIDITIETHEPLLSSDVCDSKECLHHESSYQDKDYDNKPVTYAEGARRFWKEIGKNRDYRRLRTNSSGIMPTPQQKQWTSNYLPYSSSILKQIRLLLYREIKEVINAPFVIIIQIIVTFIVAKFIAEVYKSLGNNIKANQNRMGFIFLTCHLLGQVGGETLTMFSSRRGQISHEIQTGWYDPNVYFAVSVFSDYIKYRVWVPIIFSIITYKEVGFQDHRFTFFVCIVILTGMISNLVCVLIGCLVTEKASMRVYGLVFLFNMLTAGLLANVWSIPTWLKWFGHLGFWKHVYEALMINEFVGLPIVLDPDGVPPLPTTGDYWLTQIGMYPSNRDFDVMMLVLYVVIYFFLALWAFRWHIKVRK